MVDIGPGTLQNGDHYTSEYLTDMKDEPWDNDNFASFRLFCCTDRVGRFEFIGYTVPK